MFNLERKNICKLPLSRDDEASKLFQMMLGDLSQFCGMCQTDILLLQHYMFLYKNTMCHGVGRPPRSF